jgi:hypothetical protein
VPDDAAAYLLLAVDLLVVALVLTLPLLGFWWLVGRPRRSAAEPQQRVLRRCDACGVGWKGTPRDDARAVTLKLRRWQRRRTRERKEDTPAWARRRGWSRCPSCLSTQVRTSSRHASER